MSITQAADSKSDSQLAVLKRIGVPNIVLDLIFAQPSQVDDASAAAIGSHPVGADRYALLSDEEFATIAPYLPPDAIQAQIPLRTFVDALLFMISNRPSQSWASIPDRFGGPDATRQRFTRIVLKTDVLQTLADKVKGKLDAQRQAQVESLSKHATNFAARRSRRSG